MRKLRVIEHMSLAGVRETLLADGTSTRSRERVRARAMPSGIIVNSYTVAGFEGRIRHDVISTECVAP